MLGSRVNDAEGYSKLECLSREHLKIPVKKEEPITGFVNINRSDASAYLTKSSELKIHGRPSEPHQQITNVLNHEYLRKSMVDRIEKKAIDKQYRLSLVRDVKERMARPTKTQQLRSQT